MEADEPPVATSAATVIGANQATNRGLCRLPGEERSQLPRVPLPRAVFGVLWASRYRLTVQYWHSKVFAGRPFLRFTKSATEPNRATYGRSEAWQKRSQDEKTSLIELAANRTSWHPSHPTPSSVAKQVEMVAEKRPEEGW